MVDKITIEVYEWFAEQYCSTPEQRKDRWYITSLAFAVSEALENGIDSGIKLLEDKPVYDPQLLPVMVENFKAHWGHLENLPKILGWVGLYAH